MFFVINAGLYSQDLLYKNFLQDNESDNQIASSSDIDDLDGEVKDADIPQGGVQEENIARADSLKNSAFDESMEFEKLKFPLPKIEIPQPHKSHFIAVTSNCLLPGLGHLYLKDYKTSLSLFSSALVGISALMNEYTATGGLFTLQTVIFYGAYAAYRDVRLYNKNIGYSCKMPTDSFKDLCLAPFNYKVLKKPEVWGGLLADLALVFSLAYLSEKLDKHMPRKIYVDDLSPLLAFPIGLSEESLFRGYLQSALCEPFTPVGGIILSSLVFGAAHVPNAIGMDRHERKSYFTLTIPYITLCGGYYGWVTYKNRSLKESVALHAWYDFIVFALQSVFERSISDTIKKKAGFSFCFSF